MCIRTTEEYVLKYNVTDKEGWGEGGEGGVWGESGGDTREEVL